MAILRHVVVVVPGIGGSVLAGPGGTPAWDLTAGQLIHAVTSTATLDISRELTPLRLVDTLTVFRPWWVIPGYDGLAHHLRTRFGSRLRVVDYRPDADMPADVDVVRVPYDFRRSVADSADVLGRAVAAAVGTSGRQVVVVAHSLGGLVARYWIGPGGGWPQCRALFTLGTPYRGAPRALDWLVNGAGTWGLRSKSATRMLRGWPSVFELTPQYPAVLMGGNPVEPVDLPAEVVRRCGEPEWDGGVDVLARLRAAAQVHADIAAGWDRIPQDEVPGLSVYFGRGHGTANRAVTRRGRLRVGKKDPQWRGNVGWRGDGTVPAISAIPAEWSRSPERAWALGERHGPMGSTAALLGQLVTVQGEDLPLRGAERPEDPWVGWDLDEVAATGREVDIRVEVHRGAHDTRDEPGAAATVVVGGQRHPMVANGPRWHVRVPPLAAGAHEIHVEVTEAWNGSSIYGSMPLVVVDEHDPDDIIADDHDDTPDTGDDTTGAGTGAETGSRR